MRAIGRKRHRLIVVAAVVVSLIALAIPFCAILACSISSGPMPSGAMPTSHGSSAPHHAAPSTLPHPVQSLAAVACDLAQITSRALDNAEPPVIATMLLFLTGLATGLASLLSQAAPRRLAAASARLSSAPTELRGVRLQN